jgi:hypothetical protein
MPPCKSTLGYINLALSDADEKHSSPHEAGGSIIDLAASNLEDEHTPANSDTHLSMSGELLCASSGDEPNGMEHMVVEASHASARREEFVVHRVVEGPFEFLREDRVCAWQLAKKKDKKSGRTARHRAI